MRWVSNIRNPPYERIEKFRAELDAFFDARVREMKKHCEGVPDSVIRRMHTRGMGCQCMSVLEILKQDKEASA